MEVTSAEERALLVESALSWLAGERKTLRVSAMPLPLSESHPGCYVGFA
jgi:hypothetical protein